MGRLLIHVQPRAKRDEIVGWCGERLKVRLTAPPVDNAANEALIRFLAAELGVSRADIEIRQGLTSRDKTVEIEGVNATLLRDRIRG